MAKGQGNKKRFATSTANGVQNIYVQRRYKYFIDYLTDNSDFFQNYIFRGHRSTGYKLESTLDRKITDKTSVQEIRNLQLKNFKRYIIGKRGTNPPIYTEENEWWALGQHNGLDTPLLDWTYSPYVATYFAFYKKEAITEKRVVFALNKVAVKKKIEQIDTNDIEFYRPEADDNSRIISQNGLFTKTKGGKELEEWVKTQFADTADTNDKPVLIKFLFPNSVRIECLKSLDTMNINHATLFPDIYGSCIYTNMKLFNFE